jgi:hypothetical protein
MTSTTSGPTHLQRIQQALRQAAQRRNLRTAGVLGLSVIGAPFGVGWLAASCGVSFLALMIVRVLQLRHESRDRQAGTGVPKSSMGDLSR